MLGQHPAVRSCVVVASKDEAGADFLAAYVLPKPDADAVTRSAGTGCALPGSAAWSAAMRSLACLVSAAFGPMRPAVPSMKPDCARFVPPELDAS